MGNDNKKGKQRGKKFVWFERMLRREGRKLCAVALCASMIIGNMAWPAAAASDTSGEYSFELSRASLYDALQTAISEGETVETDLEFMGEWAEDYAELLEADGSLYELSPTIKNKDEDRDKVLDLRVFARIENDIEFDSAYEVDGSEEIIFLLVNSSEVYQKAVIAVDERESDTITVLPASAVEVDTEEAVTVDTVNPVTTTTTTSGGGGGGSHSTNDIVIDNTEESAAAEYKDSEVELLNTEDPAGTTGTELNETEAENETEAQEEDGTKEQLNETSGESIDPSSGDTRGSDTDTEEKKDDADGTGTDTENGSGNAASRNSGDSGTQSGKGTGTGDAGNENTSKDETGDSGSGNTGAESSGNSGEGNTGNSGSTGNAGETGTDTESGSGSKEDTAGDTTGDSGNTETGGSGDTDNSGDDWGDSNVTVSSAISVHPTWRLTVAATASDAEQDVASPSDADDYLAGTIYETVRLDEDGVVAFVTTAGDMELDDEIFTVAGVSSAAKLSAKTENLSVVVSADEGVIPEEVTDLVVTELYADDEETADQYQEAADTLDANGVEYDGMLVLDISLVNAEGEEVEPEGEVSVVMTVNKEVLPEEADTESVMIHHLANIDNELEVESVADVADETEGSVVEEEESLMAEFSLGSFSTVTITWGSWPRNETWQNDVRFYVNLTSTIANTSTSGGEVDSGNFTDAVWQTTISSYPKKFDTEYDESSEYTVIVGDSADNAYSVDQTIRTLGEDGYFENDYSNPFKLSAFPSDEEVLTEIVSQIQNKTISGVTVNGKTISTNYLTTEYFAVRWYVFKYNRGNASGGQYKTSWWHIDGILVPKYGRLTVTKTFEADSEAELNEIVDAVGDAFTITVSGDLDEKIKDIYNNDELEQEYSLILKSKEQVSTESLTGIGYDSVTESSSGGNTATYSWTVDVLNAEYTVTETGEDATGWSDSATYTKIVDEGAISAEKDKSVTSESTLSNNSVTIYCITTTTEDEGSTEHTQTVNIFNTYQRPALKITKRFNADLPDTVLADLASKTYTFTVTASDNTTVSLVAGNTYSLLDADGNALTTGTNTVKFDSAGAATISVTGATSVIINNLPEGSYEVSETGTGGDTETYYYASNTVEGSPATLNVSSDGTAVTEVTVTNTYEPWLTLTVMKKVEGSMGDRDQEFAFEGTRSNGTINNFSLQDYTTHNDSIEEITYLKKGEVVTISETTSDGYETSVSVVSGTENALSGNVYSTGDDGLTGDTTITFINKKEVKSPTGIFTEYLPYALMVMAALLGAVWMVNDRRKKIYSDREQ